MVTARQVDLQDGDLVVTSGAFGISKAIRVATCSPYSHVAICSLVTRMQLRRHFPRLDWPGWRPKTLVFESTTLDNLADAITGRTGAGLQSHDADVWLPAYAGRVWRLRGKTLLTASESHRLADYLLTLLAQGVPYDRRGALLAGSRIAKWLPCLARRVDDRHQRYCVETVESALLAAIFDRSLPAFDPGRDRPSDLVRKCRRSGLWQRMERIQ